MNDNRENPKQDAEVSAKFEDTKRKKRNEYFASLVRKQRNKMGWTLEQCSKEIMECTGFKVPRSVLSRIEKNEQIPPYDVMFMIAYTLEIDIFDIYDKMLFKKGIRRAFSFYSERDCVEEDQIDLHGRELKAPLDHLKRTIKQFRLTYGEAEKIIKFHLEIRHKMTDILGKKTTRKK